MVIMIPYPFQEDRSFPEKQFTPPAYHIFDGILLPGGDKKCCFFPEALFS
jgi:hypothetical protein